MRCVLDGRYKRATFECLEARVQTQMLVSLAGLWHTRRKPYGRKRRRLSTLPLDGASAEKWARAREYVQHRPSD